METLKSKFNWDFKDKVVLFYHIGMDTKEIEVLKQKTI
jgi:hypothetical protein